MKKQSGSKWDRADDFLKQHRQGGPSRSPQKWGRWVLLLLVIITIVLFFGLTPDQAEKQPNSDTHQQAHVVTIDLPAPQPINASS